MEGTDWAPMMDKVKGSNMQLGCHRGLHVKHTFKMALHITLSTLALVLQFHCNCGRRIRDSLGLPT